MRGFSIFRDRNQRFSIIIFDDRKGALLKPIHFDLVNNAQDSLKHAVQLLAWPDTIIPNRYKQAILSVFHCAELLLKERLHLINPALVWENIDKYPFLSARTVAVDKAISRLASIGNINITKKDEEALKECRNLRNAIQHFKFDMDLNP